MVIFKGKTFRTIGDMIRNGTFIKHLKRSSSLVRHQRAEKRIIRAYQSRNNGRHPDLSVIPHGYYCCSYHSDVLGNAEKTMCPYWYKIKLKEAAILYGEDIVEHHIGTNTEKEAGGCLLLNTDDYKDGGMFSLLWDEVKSCPFNPEHKGVHI